MSYLQDRKTKKEKFFKIAAGTLLFLVLFYFRAGIFRGLSFAAGEVFRPVFHLGSKVGGSFVNLGFYFSSKRSLSEENQELKQQLESREAGRSNYDVLVRENESLKNIISRLPEENKLVLAAILAKPNRSPYDTLLIDLGARAGVEKGDMVYAYGNMPIGRVASVTDDTSKAVLFSSPGENTQVVISDVGRQEFGRPTSELADLQGAVAYSDSFFPFPDAPEVLISRGIKTIFSTSGSVNDEKIIELCKNKGINLIMLPDSEARGFFQH